MDPFIQLRKNGWGDYQSETWDEYKGYLRYWQKNPYPISDFLEEVVDVVDRYPELGLREFTEKLADHYPKEYKKLLTALEKQEFTHRIACSQQTNSPLLSLPRELRDKIWKECTSNNIIHVTPHPSNVVKDVAGRPSRRRQKFQFFLCTSPLGMKSTACPPGTGHHRNCITTGRSNALNLNLVCKTINQEIPKWEKVLFTRNALQFPDLVTAEKYLFKLQEKDRASITHLRLNVPWHYTRARATRQVHYDEQSSQHDEFQAICNYFSNPWDRKCLNMNPKPDDPPAYLKLPIYFYYSSSYYNSDADRLWKRYQVGRGYTSWDIGISDMIYKGCPKMDLCIEPNPGLYIPQDPWKWSQILDRWNLSLGDEEGVREGWLEALLQFRNYDGLEVKLYGEQDDELTNEENASEEKLQEERDKQEWIDRLKAKVRGSIIGPQIVPFIAGKPHGNGVGMYMQERN